MKATRPRRSLAVAVAAVVAAGIALAVPQSARADQIDNILGDAGDFLPYFNYVKKGYDDYNKYIAGQPVNNSTLTAISTARTQIIAEIDSVFSSLATACAKTTVNDFMSINSYPTDVLLNRAHDAAECINVARALITSESSQAGVDAAGIALNTAGPLALITNEKANLPIGLLKQTLIEGNQQLLTKLQPTCSVRFDHYKAFDPDEAGGIDYGRPTCVPYTASLGTGTLPFLLEKSHPIICNECGPNGDRDFPAVQDYSIAVNQAMAKTSYSTARVALNNLLDGLSVPFGPPIAAALSSKGSAKGISLFQANSDGTVLHARRDAYTGPLTAWAAYDGASRVTTTRTVAAASNADGRVELFSLDKLGNIYHRWQTVADDNTSWSDPATMDGNLTSIALARNASGALQLFGTGPDGRVWTRWQQHGADQTPGIRNLEAGWDWDANPPAPGRVAVDTWSSWVSLDGTLSQVTATENQDGTIELFGIDSTGAVRHRRQSAPDAYQGWGAWNQLPGTLTSIAATYLPANITGAGQTIVLYGTTGDASNNVVKTNQVGPNGTVWNDYSSLPGVTARTITATTDPVGFPNVFAVDDGGHIFVNDAGAVNNPGAWTSLTTAVAGNPTATGPGNQTTLAGQSVQLTESVTDGVGPYTWSATGLPPGVSIAATTGTVSGVPTTAGTYSVSVTATDSNGKKSAAVSFSWVLNQVIVPDIVGLNRISASGTLYNAGGLQLGNETDRPIASCDDSINTVVDQSPAAGTPVNYGSSVNFTYAVKPTHNLHCQ